MKNALALVVHEGNVRLIAENPRKDDSAGCAAVGAAGACHPLLWIAQGPFFQVSGRA